MTDRRIQSVVIDTSVFLGRNRRIVTALLVHGYLKGYWGHWITMELGRIRAEWIGLDAVRKGWDLARTRREQDRSSEAVNDLVDGLTQSVRAVDYGLAPPTDLSKLADRRDHPIVLTARVAGADAVVTEDRGFPIGEEMAGVLFVDTRRLLDSVYQEHPDAQSDVAAFLLAGDAPDE